jgi:hypothetical protein
VCLIAPALTAVLQSYSKELLYGYSIGFELIVINGLLSYLGLWMLRKK